MSSFLKIFKTYFNKLISNNVPDGLKVEPPRTSHFHIQPKIKKETQVGLF